MSRAHLMTGGRYPVLRSLGILYVFGAAVVALGGIGMTLWALFAAPGSMGERMRLGAWTLAATFFSVVTVLAVAELIKLLIDIEHNTRAAAMGGGGAASNGNTAGHVNRLANLDEESAEAALLRGH